MHYRFEIRLGFGDIRTIAPGVSIQQFGLTNDQPIPSAFVP